MPWSYSENSYGIRGAISERFIPHQGIHSIHYECGSNLKMISVRIVHKHWFNYDKI